MARNARLRIVTKLGNPMEPMCVHVCADEELIATVSLEDFDNACEALKRIRQNKFTAEGEETSDAIDQYCELKQLRHQSGKENCRSPRRTGHVIREMAEGKLTFSGISGKMTDRVRIIRHEIVPLCGSFEVRIAGQPSRYFYWDSVPSRRLQPDQLTKEEALAQAQALARAERDKGG